MTTRNGWSIGEMIWGSAIVASLLAGCAAETRPDGADVLGREQPNQCGGSVPRNLANLAAASADELRRWEATRDLRVADDGTVVLSADAEARCGRGCSRVRSV